MQLQCSSWAIFWAIAQGCTPAALAPTDSGSSGASDAAPDAQDAAPPDAHKLVGPGTDALMALMKKDDASHYDQAIKAGVKFYPTADGESFYGYWAPSNFSPKTDGFVVTLPGHDAFASTGFTVWQPSIAAPRNYGIIALQWWFGTGETANDYLTPSAIYPIIQQAISDRGVSGAKVLFEGFSRGAGNTYPIVAMDKASASPLFFMTIADSGSKHDDYPPVADINNLVYGDKPFANTHWILYCGGLDPDPDSGCKGMGVTETWLKGYGATIDLFIQDAEGDHGGFSTRIENTNKALALYESMRKL